MSFLADALWNELKYGVLARSRAAYDECAALHADGKVDAVVARAQDAFAGREDNWKDALEHVWGHVKRHDLRRDLDKRLAGKHADLVLWLYDVVVAHAPDLANSRFFLDPPQPDRVWVHRSGSWDLAWRHGGEWKLKNLKAVREASLPPLETMLRVRVAGVERDNPRLPKP